MGFWSNLASADNSQVHTPNIILMAIGILLMLLSVALIIYHCFIHRKGIDGDTVKLILGLLGGGVLNAGASYFSKTVVSNVTAVGAPDSTPPKAKPAPPEEVG
jgi:hypothetical protein